VSLTDRSSEAQWHADSVSDRMLMDDIDAGSLDAFAQLYDRYCDRAYRLAFSVCRDDGCAQDAVQEAFLSVWKSPGSYRPHRGTVAAWFLAVVRYRAIDLTRRNARHEVGLTGGALLELRSGPEDTTDAVIRRDDARTLRASLAQLPEVQQEVIALSFYGQLTHTEIAAQLQLPAGTVKGRMRLGMGKLRSTLEQTAV
jgi:RNA polymerase sigma-70 factor, ECF subfamily